MSDDTSASIPERLVLRVPEAGALFGWSRAQSYRKVKEGTWPTRVIRAGRSIRIPTADVRRLLLGDEVSA